MRRSPCAIRILAAAILLGLPATAAAQGDRPSFDCKKARTPVETAICGNAYLSGTDGTMGRYYAALRAVLPAGSAERKTLRANQIAWLQRRTAACLGRSNGGQDRDALTSCLNEETARRLVALTRLNVELRGGAYARAGRPDLSGRYLSDQAGITGSLLVLEWPDRHVTATVTTVRTNRGAHVCHIDMDRLSQDEITLTYVSPDKETRGCRLSVRVLGGAATVTAQPCLRRYWCGANGFMSGQYVLSRQR